LYNTVLPRAVSQTVSNFARGVFTLRYAVVRAQLVHTSPISSPVLTYSLSDLEYKIKPK